MKTAIAAGDANWGRVVMAVGKTAEPVERDRISLWFGDHQVAKDGARSPDYSEEKATRAVSGQEVFIRVDVGVGRGQGPCLDLRSHRWLREDKRGLQKLSRPCTQTLTSI